MRKDWHDCTKEERDLYIDGYLALRRNGKLAAITREHVEAANRGFDNRVFHGNDGFLPWHRYFVWELERQIQQLGGKYSCFALPYWDWTRTAGRTVASNPMFTQGLGGNGSGNDRCVRDRSKFSEASGYRTTANRCLRRDFQGGTHWYRSTADAMRLIELRTSSYASFRGQLEGWHGMAHVSVGGRGDLGNTATATDDPMFFLLHSYVDYLWALRSDCHDFGPNTRDNRAFPISQIGSTMTYPVLAQQTWAYARGRTLVAAMMMGTSNWGYTYHMSNQRARSGLSMANCRFNEIRGAVVEMPEQVMLTEDESDESDKRKAYEECMKIDKVCKSKPSTCTGKQPLPLSTVLAGADSEEVRKMREIAYPFAVKMRDTINLCKGTYDCTCRKLGGVEKIF